MLIAGGGRAILLQLAYPAVGHGVAAHSDFADRSLDRLQNTLRFVYAVAFGTPAQLAFVTRVRSISCVLDLIFGGMLYGMRKGVIDGLRKRYATTLGKR